MPEPTSSRFNGGTITSGLVIAPTGAEEALVVQAPVGYSGTIVRFSDDDQSSEYEMTEAGSKFRTEGAVDLRAEDAAGGLIQFPKGLTIQLQAAPADGSLGPGEASLWFDSTNGAAKLMVKAKQADGTVKTASIAVA